MTFRFHCGLAVAMILPLASCQSLTPQQQAANNYLSTYKTKHSTSINEWRCLKELDEKNNLPIEIQSWDVLKQEQKIDEDDKDSQYNEVSVKIISIAPGGFPVTQTWKATVWKTDDFFEMQKRFSAKFDQVLIDSNKTINQMNEQIGEAKLPPPTLTAPSKNDITANTYCVTGFRND